MSLFGECSRVGCSRPRARNPRTSAIHDYCSLRCSRIARLGTEDDGTFKCCYLSSLVFAAVMEVLFNPFHAMDAHI